jgi:hypothetical protein
MVSLAADLYDASFFAKVLHLSDVALRVRSVNDDADLVRLSPDPHSCCGLLQVQKFSLPGAISLPTTEPMLLMVRSSKMRTTADVT